MTTKTRNITFMPGGRSRFRRMSGLLAMALAVALGRPLVSQAQINVTITADNSYAFGYGWGPEGISASAFYGPVENCTHDDIFSCATGPETYPNTPVPPSPHGGFSGPYLYIVAWSDDAVTQGLLADFQVDGYPSALTGVGDWQVFATGINFDCGSGGPPLNGVAGSNAINRQIALANSCLGGPNSSIGWVNMFGPVNCGGGRGTLVVGEDNTDPTASADPPVGPNNFSPACSNNGLAAAKWMWYAHEDSVNCGVSVFFTDPDNVFNTNDELPNGCPPGYLNREYLIFRLRVSEIQGAPMGVPAVSAWGLVFMTLLILTAASVVIMRRRAMVHGGS